ncbi:UDP-N-acetylmuramate dehydrogenase [Paracoccaceae bacterium]|nr:UDP-N-acetylmuramate dehydrogenase [Paracoccaceae bacterium]
MINLPNVRGKIKKNLPLSTMSWLKVGGPAEVLFKPKDILDLQEFFAKIDRKIPIFVLGACSNLIIRDGGIDGVCIRLGKQFNKIVIQCDGLVVAGAASFGSHVAQKAAVAGIDLTFLRTIPGTIGGAVFMNAGCYGRYIKDVLVSAEFISREGLLHTLGGKDLEFSYRRSKIPNGWVMTKAFFKSNVSNPEYLNSKMEDMIANRNNTQPRGELSCGSAFKNPSGRASSGKVEDTNELKAWKMIEDAGLRGFQLGGAKVSTKHSNFLINTGEATSAQLEELGEIIMRQVFDHSGVKLEWEIKLVGKNSKISNKIENRSSA